MNIYMVRLLDRNVRGSVIGIELHALSEQSVRAFCELQYREYEVVAIIEEGSEEHQRAVEVATQLLQMASYSSHPAAKTAAIFALPAAKLGMVIVEKVNRAVDQGARNTKHAAQKVWDDLFGS